MHVRERVKEGSSDMRNYYWCGSIVTFGKWKRKAPWMVPDKILYRYGDFDWVP
ncbi:hypothetical protein Goari_027016 [Gossypium aridum]|uniref:Uncharacterized protein n=1 Tax=Gossypium aridum TaxID=34290 RepID=A0A7J8YL98_GOSAI|nr:hypothetical protein [Gossypium aridum]